MGKPSTHGERPLPSDWQQRVRAVIQRDRVCRWTDTTVEHGGRMTVDHVGDKHDHSLNNLRLICEVHHALRTSWQGAMSQGRQPKLTRPKDKHPGLT